MSSLKRSPLRGGSIRQVSLAFNEALLDAIDERAERLGFVGGRKRSEFVRELCMMAIDLLDEEEAAKHKR